MRRIPASIATLLFAFGLFAESHQTTTHRRDESPIPQIRCGADAAMSELYRSVLDAEREARELDRMVPRRIAQGFPEELVATIEATTYVIPTVFHVFGASYSGITVNDALVEDALRRLNEDFQGLTADWSSVAPLFAPIKRPLSIEFKLAKLDPDGQPTTGITYHPPAAGFGNGSGYNEQIQQYAWDNYKYLNVYVMLDLYDDGVTNNSGVAWYPNTWMSNNNLARVVYNGRYLGTNTSENFRRVLTHEFGHYLNLAHTFDGGCSEPNDRVSDTPKTTANSGMCNTTIEKCAGAGIPNGENFMDYTQCYRMFTAGQVERMQAALQHSTRYPLWQPANLIATGVATTSCDYALSRTSDHVSLNGGSGSVGVDTAEACDWTATSNTPWILITGGASGTGDGTVSYSVDANSGSARTGTITIAGDTFTVSQSGRKRRAVNSASSGVSSH